MRAISHALTEPSLGKRRSVPCRQHLHSDDVHRFSGGNQNSKVSVKDPKSTQILLSKCHTRSNKLLDKPYLYRASTNIRLQYTTPISDLAAVSIGRGATGRAYHITQQGFRHRLLVIAMTTCPQETPDLGQEKGLYVHIAHDAVKL